MQQETKNKLLKRAGWVISGGLILTAIYILWNKLKNISWTKVGIIISETPTSSLLMAAGAVCCAYLTLTLYDYFALRAIGRHEIKYRTAALGSFTSYSIAHNLGATVFTAAVVRYLIYSRFGLTAAEVIKVCFLAGLTFWLGNATVLGLGFTLEPEAVAPIVANIGLGANTVHYAGIIILGSLAVYITFMLRNNRTIGKGDWSLTLPDGKHTAMQIGIGIIDLTFMAVAMYLLLPKGADMIPFRELMVVFITAMLLGFASHAPGGMGAFEASMLLALPHLDAEQVVAAIIMFRIYYFLIPFVLALLLVTIREVTGSGGSWANVKESMREIKGAEGDKKENLKVSPLKSNNP